MENNLKLLDALKAVNISLLEGSIEYNWDKISQDNVGILAQAITRTDRVSLYEEYLKDISTRVAKRRRTTSVPSWTDMLAEYWPMTGAPIAPIFIELREAGLKRSDIYDLEYLTGKICDLAQISPEDKELEYTEVRKETKGFWFFKKEYEVISRKIKSVEYYKHQDNLLKFYKAWMKQLEEQGTSSIGGMIIIDGEKFPYKNSFQLEKLKRHFLGLEHYKAVDIVVKELEKYKK